MWRERASRTHTKCFLVALAGLCAMTASVSPASAGSARQVGQTASAGGSALGRTAEELALWYGVRGQYSGAFEDRHGQESFGPMPDLSTDPILPAATALVFAPLGSSLQATVGFNAEGTAIYVRSSGWGDLNSYLGPVSVKRGPTESQVTAALTRHAQATTGAITQCLRSYGYDFIPDAGAQQLFPPKGQVEAKTETRGGWRHIIGTGLAVSVPMHEVVTGTYGTGISRFIYRDPSGVAYAFYDYSWDDEVVYPSQHWGPLMVCDANTFWTWVIGDRTSHHAWDSLADEDQYEFGPGSNGIDDLTALGMAFREIVWNPFVSDQLVERTVAVLFDQGEESQVLAELERIAAGPNTVAQGRAEYALRTREVQALLDGGADVDAMMLLHQVASSGSARTAAFLLQHGASVDLARPGDGCTPVHIAALNGRADVVEFLLAHGADASGAAANGRTALHFAVLAGDANRPVITLLLNAGAVPQAQDGAGLTPADVAEQSGHQELATYLREQAGSPEAQVELPDR